MGRNNTYHVSEKIGNGQVMKSINQVMIATGMAIVSEAVTMAVNQAKTRADIRGDLKMYRMQ